MLQPRLLNVTPGDNYNLLLSYENGEQKMFDVSAYISGDWYGQLRDERYFKTVHIIDGGTGIEWADGQDIAPHELYELSAAVLHN